jgi:hypothetical protein
LIEESYIMAIRHGYDDLKIQSGQESPEVKKGLARQDLF